MKLHSNSGAKLTRGLLWRRDIGFRMKGDMFEGVRAKEGISQKSDESAAAAHERDGAAQTDARSVKLLELALFIQEELRKKEAARSPQADMQRAGGKELKPEAPILPQPASSHKRSPEEGDLIHSPPHFRMILGGLLLAVAVLFSAALIYSRTPARTKKPTVRKISAYAGVVPLKELPPSLMKRPKLETQRVRIIGEIIFPDGRAPQKAKQPEDVWFFPDTRFMVSFPDIPYNIILWNEDFPVDGEGKFTYETTLRNAPAVENIFLSIKDGNSDFFEAGPIILSGNPRRAVLYRNEIRPERKERL
jgi:hypothetical protein